MSEELLNIKTLIGSNLFKLRLTFNSSHKVKSESNAQTLAPSASPDKVQDPRFDPMSITFSFSLTFQYYRLKSISLTCSNTDQYLSYVISSYKYTLSFALLPPKILFSP